jgi:EAL domain-containing protein (putative c-di-GMP-specific phosphodiesterase class I)
VGQRIQNAFATPIVIDQHRITTTASIGIALFPDDAADLGELQRHADAALYEAKHAGGNVYHFFSRELQDRTRRRRELEQDLRGALEAGQFHLVYLPEMDVQSGAVLGYEALLRWNRYRGQSLSAREFLHVLDESGELIRVGEWVIQQVAADAAILRRTSSLRLSINVSAGELANPNFLSVVERALQAHGIEGGQLELELTEGCLSTHFADARSKLPLLAALGVAIAVDGYGAGRSSILELAELPIHTLKLHESFLVELDAGPQHAALAAIVGVAKGLGWSVVAKCVETSEQFAMIRRLGCQRAQGRFWGATVRSPGFVLENQHPVTGGEPPTRLVS